MMNSIAAKDVTASQMSLLIDFDRCIGCHACTVVCQDEHQDPRSVKRLRVDTVGSGRHDIPAGTYPDVWMYFQPRMCQHCSNPPCIDACPFDAMLKDESGVVKIIDADCTGCELCIPACPYDVIAMNQEQALVAICDMCSGRTELGLIPACADACPGDAIFFGDLHDRNSGINTQRRKLPKPAYLLSGGGAADDVPSVRYQTMKPQRELDNTILVTEW